MKTEKRYHCVCCTVTAWLPEERAKVLGWTTVEGFEVCPPCGIRIDRKVRIEEEGAHAE